MMLTLRKIPDSVWRSADFDCEAVFNEVFSNVDPIRDMERIQDEIKALLRENTAYFTKYSTILSNKSNLENIIELSTIISLESERMESSTDKAELFSMELNRIAGDLIHLAEEKKGLMTLITRNKKIQMIESGLNQIELLRNENNFKEISNILLATEQLLKQHDEFQDSDREIGNISDRLESYKVLIERDLIRFVEESIDSTGKLKIPDPTEIFGCCLAADILENNLRAILIKIYLDKQFKAYRNLHPPSLNVLDLKNLDKRFKWGQRMLSFYEKTFKFAFPSDWQVEILLGQSIGNWIKEDIVTILSAVPLDRRVDEDIFTQALSEANSFDRFISLKFHNILNSSVSQAFQDFHYFLFEVKEDEFQALIKKIFPADCVKSAGKVLKRDHLVLVNVDQIFIFFSNILDTFSHLSSMSSGVLLVQFSFFLSDCLESVCEYIEKQFEIISLVSHKKWSNELGRLLAALISSLDYFMSSLQEQSLIIISNIKSADLKEQVSLEMIKQKLLVTQSIGMTVLLNRYELDLTPIFSHFVKIDWEQDMKTQTPSDPSPFLIRVTNLLEKQAKFTLINVSQALQPQTSKTFHEKFLTWFTAKLYSCLFKFKIINEIGAEQLMIDLFGFRSFFQLKILPTTWKAKDIALWSQFVTATTARYETYLKVLLTPIEPVDPFVQSYLLLLTDFNVDNFIKLLEIKGIIRKSDQLIFLQEFEKHVPLPPSGQSLLIPSATASVGGVNTTTSEFLLDKFKQLNLMFKYSRKSKSRF